MTASTRVFISDFAHGLAAVSHNSLAACGLIVLTAAVVLFSRTDVRSSLEDSALDWLLARQEARLQGDAASEEELAEVSAVDRATATDPKRLGRQQSLVAQWLSRRYRVAPEPVSALVQEAWNVGAKARLEPTLILAIMAVESSFNPFAQSSVGAQGLMQVMTSVHDDKYEAFGGNHAAFDPLTNLRVGVAVLKECIARAGGSLEGGLRLYVGAGSQPDDGGYATKVLAEEQYMRQVAQGHPVPATVKLPSAPAPEPLRVADASPVAVAAGSGIRAPAAVAALPPTAPMTKPAAATPAAEHASIGAPPGSEAAPPKEQLALLR